MDDALKGCHLFLWTFIHSVLTEPVAEGARVAITGRNQETRDAASSALCFLRCGPSLKTLETQVQTPRLRKSFAFL